ncbi:hypothetical protein BC834DRAFT_695354 [Gloeopeniophorella convolvens]|nr:hypothetical protein BC834DRAFT_695354 [Gloeopeniophorella convolvens]
MGRHEWVTSRMPTHAIPGWDLRRNRLRSDHMLVKRAVVCSLAEKPAALVRPLRGTRLRESSPASWASRETEPYHYRSSAAKPGEWGMRRVCRGLGALENCLSDDSQGPVIQPSNKPRRRYKSQPYQRVRLAPVRMIYAVVVPIATDGQDYCNQRRHSECKGRTFVAPTGETVPAHGGQQQEHDKRWSTGLGRSVLLPTQLGFCG